ncbi:hypothetical protein B0H34DRAFT_738223 [Crassisporium funariophilum]|nr:hypothetical protein B0H34DRAFT_738223 [Crassisporium funariophilum]
MFSPEMPPLVDEINPPFYPPPHGASNGGQPGFFDAFPGTRGGGGNAQPSTSYWPAQGTPYPSYQSQLPNWPISPGAQPTSAQSWTYGSYPPASTPVWPSQQPSQAPVWGQTQATSWGAPTPGSWGAPTPGGTWGAPSPAGSYGPPRTPNGGYAPNSPWGQQSQQQLAQPHSASASYYPPNPPGTPYDSAWGQPITAGFFGAGNESGDGEGYRIKKVKQKKSDHGHENLQHSTSMRRTTSHGPPPRRNGLQRSASYGHVGDFAGYSYQGYAQGDSFDESNLARRPRDWRPDYSVRPGITSYIPRVGKSRSDVKEFVDPVRRDLHPLLQYQPNHPPIYHDMREHPFSPEYIEFLNLHRPANEIDFAQLCIQPTSSFMRLYHPRLPWYIDIHQSHPNGVTVYDIFSQINRQLHTPIHGRHYWNEELGDSERAGISSAFQERCRGDPGMVSLGVMQVDFLGKKCVFEGLVRGAKGLWEIKTGKVQP